MERECEILIVDDAQTIAGSYGDSTIRVFEISAPRSTEHT